MLTAVISTHLPGPNLWVEMMKLQCQINPARKRLSISQKRNFQDNETENNFFSEAGLKKYF